MKAFSAAAVLSIGVVGLEPVLDVNEYVKYLVEYDYQQPSWAPVKFNLFHRIYTIGDLSGGGKLAGSTYNVTVLGDTPYNKGNGLTYGLSDGGNRFLLTPAGPDAEWFICNGYKVHGTCVTTVTRPASNSSHYINIWEAPSYTDHMKLEVHYYPSDFNNGKGKHEHIGTVYVPKGTIPQTVEARIEMKYQNCPTKPTGIYDLNLPVFYEHKVVGAKIGPTKSHVVTADLRRNDCPVKVKTGDEPLKGNGKASLFVSPK